MHKYLSRSLVVVACLLAACGGRVDVYETPPGDVPVEARAITLPDPIPAVPSYRVDLKRTISQSTLRRIANLDGVVVVATVDIRRARVTGPAGTERMTIGTVDPLRFRPVSPVATRDATFVWTALIQGKAVPTFDAAESLGIEGAVSVTIQGMGAVAVGAFADNGTPSMVDLLVAADAGGVSVDDADAVVVGVSSGATIEPIGEALERRLQGAGRVVRVLPEAPGAVEEPPEPRAVGTTTGGVIPGMNFEILKNGFIDPDDTWVASNIASGSVPILGEVTCHRLLFPQLAAALSEIVDQGLSSLIDPGDYGGCYVPRFIDRDPNKPLSMHAFGLAVDLNVSSNPLGTRGNMDERVIAIFEQWGFRWGGRFARPDPMHFELARLVSTR